jgi:hypothetical protein
MWFLITICISVLITGYLFILLKYAVEAPPELNEKQNSGFLKRKSVQKKSKIRK